VTVVILLPSDSNRVMLYWLPLVHGVVSKTLMLLPLAQVRVFAVPVAVTATFVSELTWPGVVTVHEELPVF